MDCLPASFDCHLFNIPSLHDSLATLVYGEDVFPQNGHDFHVQ
jgi:hypothetical protein